MSHPTARRSPAWARARLVPLALAIPLAVHGCGAAGDAGNGPGNGPGAGPADAAPALDAPLDTTRPRDATPSSLLIYGPRPVVVRARPPRRDPRSARSLVF